MKNNKNPGQEPLYTTEDVLYTNERLVKDKNAQMPEKKDDSCKLTKKDKFFLMLTLFYVSVSCSCVYADRLVDGYKSVDLLLWFQFIFVGIIALYNFVAPARRWITKHLIETLPD